ncbi:MAG TPA: repressor LexA [Rhodospirillaceae bacterium]|nr:MAG: repressor LexA [Alphaproteobacteria bacterium GWF2_58_20]HAU28497.1 repressor LexA [Rhodospirillaceae bacterium]
MLTRKQHALLQFIHARLQDSGISPSFDEMKDALGLKSKSGIHRLIGSLEERGFLKRLPHRARALEVIRMSEDVSPKSVPASMPSGVLHISRGKSSKPQPLPANDICEIPLYGQIAAGTPIEAIAETGNMLALPHSLIGRGEYYALTVAGDSMVGDGILDGDTIIIRKTEVARDGEIVVALVDEQEATLKRLRRKGSTVELVASNPAYPPRLLPAGRVRVQGKLAGLIRNY